MICQCQSQKSSYGLDKNLHIQIDERRDRVIPMYTPTFVRGVFNDSSTVNKLVMKVGVFFFSFQTLYIMYVYNLIGFIQQQLQHASVAQQIGVRTTLVQ